MAKKDRKKKRSGTSGGGGGSTMSGLRSGFKGVVGVGGKTRKKESRTSRIITYALLAAAVGALIYRIVTR